MQIIQRKFFREQQRKIFRFAFILLGLGILLLLMRVLHREEAGKEAIHSQTKDLDLSENAESLVEAIASLSLAPKIHPRTTHNSSPFDDDFDWSEYARVNQSIKYLASRAEEVWPTLVKHFSDERYSTTIYSDEDDAAYIYTVGDICRKIVQDHLARGYLKHYLFVSDEPYHVINPPGRMNSAELKDWCEKHKDKKLYEMQIEMCEWVIEKMSKLERFDAEERQAFIDAVRKEIAELKISRKSEPIGKFLGYEGFRPFEPEKHEISKPGPVEK